MSLPNFTRSPINIVGRKSGFTGVPDSTGKLLGSLLDPFGVYCVLEVQLPGGGSLFHLFPVMPESLDFAQRYLQSITPTQGGVFVDDFGRAPSPIMLSGTFGRSPRLEIAAIQEQFIEGGAAASKSTVSGSLKSKASQLLQKIDRSSGTPPAPRAAYESLGYRLVKLLSEMVEISHLPSKEGKLPTVKFYNFAFGQYYEVTLDSFDARMSVERNGLWLYRLQMTVIRRLNSYDDSNESYYSQELPDQVLNAARSLNQAALNNSLGRVTWTGNGTLTSKASAARLQAFFDGAAKVTRAVNWVNGFVTAPTALDLVNLGAGYLDDRLGLRRGTIGGFIDQVRRLPETWDAVRNIVNQVSKRLPSEIRETIIATREATQEITLAITPILQVPDTPPVTVQPYVSPDLPLDTYPLPRPTPADVEILELAATVDEALDCIEILLDIYDAAENPSSTVSVVLDSPPEEGSATGADTYVIRQGDTLAKIANLFYGNEDAWPRIAQANRLLFGDALANGDPFNEIAPTDLLDLYLGTTIKVPRDVKFQGDLVPYIWDTPVGAGSLGTDLPDTLQVNVRQDGTKELLVLDPLSTLLQGLIHRLQTPVGTIGDDPFFGSAIPGLVGQSFGVLDEPMNSVKVDEALRADPRLQTVDRVIVQQSMDTLDIEFQATAKNAGSLGKIDLTLSRQSP